MVKLLISWPLHILGAIFIFLNRSKSVRSRKSAQILQAAKEKEEAAARESGPQTLTQGPGPDTELVEVAKLDQKKLRLTLKRSRWIGWSLVGIGAASAGFATFAAIRGMQAEQKFVNQEDPDDRRYSDAAGEQANLFVYIGSGFAAVSAGVGVVFLARALRSKRRLKRLEMQRISVGPQMGLSFRF